MDYIPSTHAGKLTFGQNMVALITPAPTSWGLTAGIATQLGTYVSDYEAKFQAATEPATKSRANTFAAKEARKVMVGYIRDLVLTIQGTATVTDQMRHDLGITVRGANPPTPIHPPDEAPILEIISVINRLIMARLRSSSSERRGKPDNAQGASICMYTGPLPLPTEITAWTTIGESTRTNFEMELPPSVTPGTTVHLVAFWKSPRLMSGPASAPVSLVIGAGVQQAA